MVFLQGRKEMGLKVGRKGVCTDQSLSGPGGPVRGPPRTSGPTGVCLCVAGKLRRLAPPQKKTRHLYCVGMKEASQTR